MTAPIETVPLPHGLCAVVIPKRLPAREVRAIRERLGLIGMSLCCPDCATPVNVAPHAREGRCDQCRPRRRHSKPRRVGAGDRYRALLAEHQDHG